MAYAGIADDEFQVTLAQGDRGGVNNPDDSKGGEETAPHLETLREKIHGHAQPRIRAQFHYDAGQQHRTGGRRGDMTSWRPGVQRPDARQDGKSDKQHWERPGLKLRRELKLGELLKIQ